jgi:hypothetical protein
VACENRWASGHTGQGTGVVALEADAVVVEPLPGMDCLVAPGEDVGGS